MHKNFWFPATLAALALFFALTPAFVQGTSELATAPQAILHILDYLSVDYPSTVENGAVTEPEEYEEQREFVQQLMVHMQQLPEQSEKSALLERAATLATAIAQRAPGTQVQTLCAELSAGLITAYHVPIAPARLPPLSIAAALFQQHCVACHGAEGLGNGPAAAALQPPPSNFHLRERQAQRSVYGLYSTITLGVEGTAMPAFTRLSEDERWALAFYVSNFLATEAERAEGKRLWQQGRQHEAFTNLGTLTQATPAMAAAQHGPAGAAVLAYLRSTPEQVMPTKLAALQFSREQLAASLQAYRAGEKTRAYDLAVAAYLEGFELAEASLSVLDGTLKQRIEADMGQYRQTLRRQAPVPVVAAQEAALQQLLHDATARLQTTHLSPTMGFVGALSILVREGLEAMLVIAAIVAFLIKLQRRDALRYVHIGWVGALATGGLTWLAAKHLIHLSGANRELTEGLTALVATIMLVYVGLWLHSHAHAQQWQRFLHGKVRQTLTGGTIWSLALISFIAVYREVVETVLFYETLWLQAGPASHTAIFCGLGTAVLVLLILGWTLFRLSVRLPLQLFFRINAALLLILAVIFAGKGISALQEAGQLPVNPVHLPTISLLGIYPTLEGLGLQIAVIGGTLLWIGYRRLQEMRLDRPGTP